MPSRIISRSIVLLCVLSHNYVKIPPWSQLSGSPFAPLAYVNLLLINIVAITWHFFALYTIIRRINKAKFLSLSFAHLSCYIPPCISEECVCHACANMRCEAGAKLHDNLSPHRRFLSYCFAVFLR